MDAPEQPQIYLITPPQFELSSFPTALATVMDAHEVACVRLALASQDQDRLSRAADALREITTARDVALVIDDHVQLAQNLGLDGVHLTDAARSVRTARKTLGADAIVGCHCGTSRHDGMTAGEAGADYVSFGPAGTTALGDGSQADDALFAWWSEMIEIPCVAQGALDEERISALCDKTDFFGIGDEIWAQEDPAAALGRLIKAMG